MTILVGREVAIDAGQVILPGQACHNGGVGQPDIKGIAPAKGAVVFFGDANHAHGDRTQQDDLTQRVFAIGEQFVACVIVNNGILIADSGNKTYEIRFASAELGQIRVELSMDGAKPEASVLYNNADAEKPLRDLFGSLQTRMANLGIENLSLRQDTGRNPGGDDTSGNQKIAGGNAVDSTADASEITYYIAPEMIDAGRLDIRF